MKRLFVITVILITAFSNSFSQGCWKKRLDNFYSVNFIMEVGTTFFAGTYEDGVFISTEKGESWTYLASLNELANDNSFSCMTANGKNLFIGSRKSGVYRSTDNGASWTQVNNGLGTLSVSCLATIGNKIMAVADGSLYVSSDNGESWEYTPYGIFQSSVNCLHVFGSCIFVGKKEDGVFRSTDNGQNWTQVNEGLNSMDIVCFANNGSDIVVGTAGGYMGISSDNGNTWNSINTKLSINTISYMDNNIYIGDEIGICLSTNKGVSWNPINTGIKGRRVKYLSIYDEYVFACFQEGGIYRTPYNKDYVWTNITKGLNSAAKDIAVIGSDVFVSGYGYDHNKSSNNGEEWVESYSCYSDHYYRHFCSNSTYLYEGSYEGDACFSSDKGKSWYRISRVISPVMSCVDASETELFLGNWGGTLSITSDNGVSWKESIIGYNTYAIGAVRRNSSSIWVLADNYGLYSSSDFGDTWTQASIGIDNEKITCIAVNGMNIYAGTQGEGVFLSSNNGIDWQPASNGLTNQIINCIEIKGSHVFIGTDSGIFMSSAYCDLWTECNNGMPQNKDIRNIAFTNSHIFAIQSDGGIVTSELACFGINDVLESKAPSFDVEISPNPSSGCVRITTKEPFVIDKISITNSIGMLMNDFESVRFNNEGELELTLGNLASGNYFITITSNGMKTTKRMIVIK